MRDSVAQTAKRAVLYIRVSTEEQATKGFSLPEQERDLRAHAASRGWTVVELVTDDDSGRTLKNRPDLNRLRKLVDGGAVDIILVRKWDRFFRKAAYQDIFIMEMDAQGVEVISLDGQDNKTAEGRFFNRMQASFSEYFRDQIIANMRQGKQGRARSGYIVPGRYDPLGFEYDPAIRNYRVVPDKMALAARIFREVGPNGKSMRSVKKAFEAEGIPPPS